MLQRRLFIFYFTCADGSYHPSRLISSDLITSELSAVWSDPVRRGCDQPQTR